MKKLKIFLTTLLIAMVLIATTSVTFATESDPYFVKDSGEENNTVNNAVTNDTTNATTNNTVSNNTVENEIVRNTIANTSSNTSVYNNNTEATDLPDAGSSDGIILIATIVLFGIIAIYAYKKVREYNI